ncbi:hypothetical protein CXB51_019203 [Gossypium anomalum]|uniref:Uncharacterized protein n=1 Tax=Gossypium anomalum TaxID=47600 RepID=A0A8J6CWB4_9ROSI|nr:hypothetical protein CXB51_019203 [Gossypium anomalum]
MSRLSFRPRPLDIHKKLPIVKSVKDFEGGDATGWTISGAPLDLRDPRILATAAAERHLLEADYDEYAESNASGAAFCRSAVLILMALLLLRHALYLTAGDGDDDASAFFSLFMLRAAGFLLPCYIMAWAISILQRRRQRQVMSFSSIKYFFFERVVLYLSMLRLIHITEEY